MNEIETTLTGREKLRLKILVGEDIEATQKILNRCEQEEVYKTFKEKLDILQSLKRKFNL